MIFSEQQINQILKIIDFQHLMFIGHDVDVDLLNEDDRFLLRSFGVEPNQLRQDFTPYEQAFYFGRLAAALKDQTKKFDYNDFLQYLRRGQYIPLSEKERNALNYIKRQTYSHIKNLSFKIRSDIEGIILREDAANRHVYENIIRTAGARTIKERDSVRNMVLEIGNKTGDWGRDLGRICETELQNATETGTLEWIIDQKGEDALIYRDVYPGACMHCIRLYLTAGIGSEPKLFKVKDIIANGDNYGLKAKNYLPVPGSTHPFCRCRWHLYEKGLIWNSIRRMYEEPKEWERKVERKAKARIYVGDKIIEV